MLKSLRQTVELIKSSLDEKLRQNEKVEVTRDTENYESRIEEIRNTKNEDIIKINVGGKIFATRYETLLNVKDNLFHKIIMSKKMDIRKGIFIDRSPEYFHIILDYLRFQKFESKRYKSDQLNEIREEILYYEILPLEKIFDELSSRLEYIKISVSSWYDGVVVDPKVLLDKDLNNGVLTNSPGTMEVEMKNEEEFDRMEIGGYTGKPDWINSSGYGAGAKILTSIDGKNWKEIGIVPSGFGNTILIITFNRTKAKFIKIVGTSWLAIGYMKIFK